MTAEPVAATGRDPDAATRRRALVAATIGNFLEWYEFGVYGTFATAIGATFFPGHSANGALAVAFAAFGVSYVFRPLGALVFGHFGDRIGRRRAVAVAVLGMSATTTLVGLLPGYAVIGAAGPVLLGVLRAVQGFSLGGEYGGATALMIEYAPPERRTSYGAWQVLSQFVAVLVSSVIGVMLDGTLTAEQLLSWGWRLPLLVAFPLGAVGLYLRLRLPETPNFARLQRSGRLERSPLSESLRRHRANLLRIFLVNLLTPTVFYSLITFYPGYLSEREHVSHQWITLVVLLTMVGLSAVTVGLAALADRVRRHRPFIMTSLVAGIVVPVPANLLVFHATIGTVVLGYALLALVVAPFAAVFTTTAAETFPTQIRYSSLSLCYSAATSIFGGFSPLLLTALSATAAGPLAAGAYAALVAVVGSVAGATLPETRNEPVADL